MDLTLLIRRTCLEKRMLLTPGLRRRSSSFNKVSDVYRFYQSPILVPLVHVQMGKWASSLADLSRLRVCYLCILASLHGMRLQKRSFNGQLRIFPGLQRAVTSSSAVNAVGGSEAKGAGNPCDLRSFGRWGHAFSTIPEGLGDSRRSLHSGHSQEWLRTRFVLTSCTPLTKA